MPVNGDIPLLLIRIVYTTLLPITVGLGAADIVTARSGGELNLATNASLNPPRLAVR